MHKKNFLAVHLRAHGGHSGRTNPELQRLAGKLGLSEHSVQSMALGRRKISDAQKAALRDAMAEVQRG